MILSDTALKIISAFMAVILSIPAVYWMFALSYKWQQRHGDTNDLHSFLTKPFPMLVLSVTIVAAYYFVSKFLHDREATASLLVATILGLVALCLLMKRRFGKLDIAAASTFMPIFTPLLCMGCSAAMSWLLPDVTIISENSRRQFTASTVYEWRPGAGMRLNGSYLDNRTDDTLYRVVVSYAIPGEDLYNIYSVSDRIPPKSFERMTGRADYYMHPVPPLMRWSVGRMGRYRTQRVFVVDKAMLTEFVSGHDMALFGLRANRRVKSIKESRNRTINEDPSRLTEYKRIIKALDSPKNH